jgi:transcriptional regulator with XRE-family HTH domain
MTRQSSSTSGRSASRIPGRADPEVAPAHSWLGASSYAAAARRAMEARGMTAAELAAATNYSYEQIRRVLKGEPIVSEQLNQLLCARLALDVTAMWSVALHEKALRRLAGDATDVTAHDDERRLLASFARLGDADRRRVLKLLDRLEHAGDHPKGVR